MRSMLPDWNETFEDGAAVFYDEPLFPVSLDSTGCVKKRTLCGRLQAQR